MKFIAFLLLFSVSQRLHAQSDAEREVKLIVNRLYKYISFSDTNSIRIDSIQQLFTPYAEFVAPPMAWPVSKYIDVIKQTIRQQKISLANEHEISHKIDIFGNIAHVLSTYELKMVINGKEMVRRGINSIQLIRDNGTWLVASLIWDWESATLKIPAKYLGE